MKASFTTKISIRFLIFLLIATSFVIWDTWSDPFLLDDVPKIKMNTDLNSWSQFFNSLSKPPDVRRQINHADPSRPLVYFTFKLNTPAGERLPQTYRWLNLIFHGLNAFLVYLLIEKLIKRWDVHSPFIAIGTGILFWISPLTLGTAAYIYARSDILMACCILLALLCEMNNKRKYSLAFTACGLLCHATAVMTPFLLLLIGATTSTLLTSCLLVGLYVGFRWLLLGGIGDSEAVSTYAQMDYFKFFPKATVEYAKIAITGIGTSLDHLVPEMIVFDGWQLGYIALFFVSAVAAWANYKKRETLAGISFGILFFITLLIPVSTIFPTTDLLADRRAYLGSMGVFLICIICLFKFSQKFKQGKIIFLIILIIWAWTMGIKSRNDLSIRKSEVIFWQKALLKNPESHRALSNLANVLNDQNKDLESLEYYNKLLTIYPNHPFAWFNRARLFYKPDGPLFDPKSAIESIEKGLAANPEHRQSHCTLANLYRDIDPFRSKNESVLCEKK